MRIERIYGLQISPTGGRVAYLLRVADVDADLDHDTLWLAEPDPASGEWRTRCLIERISDLHSITENEPPQWSPDGHWLAFLSNASGRTQLHLCEVATGRTRQLMSLSGGASAPRWSPDGRRIAVTSTDRPGGWAADNPHIRHVTEAYYRSDLRGYDLDHFEHLWLVDVQSSSASQLTFGQQDDGPAAWSPDGRRIAFERDGHVFVIEVAPAGAEGRSGDDAAIRVSTGAAHATSPAWSPDGTRLVALGTFEGDGMGLNSPVVLIVDPAGATPPSTLYAPDLMSIGDSPDFDTSIPMGLAPTWTPDGTAILFTAAQAGHMGLYRLAPTGGSPGLVLGGERAIWGVSQDSAGRLAFAASSWDDPGEVYVSDATGNGEVRITDLRERSLGDRTLITPETFKVPTRDGLHVLDAWLFRPVDFDPALTYPLVQIVHGGPEGCSGPNFVFEIQVLASRGFNVVVQNTRGGTSYGEAFCLVIMKDGFGQEWGVREEQDFWDVLDAAIDRGGIDPQRIGISGHSYGGFMAAWMPGRTDRYRAAVASGPVTSNVSWRWTGPFGQLEAPENSQWERLDWWWSQSPLSMVPAMTAPMLFITGEQDFNTPAEQAEQLYKALHLKGVPTEMIRWVDAGHGASTRGHPSVRRARAQVIADWFARWL